jgi:hypothetical protein
MKVYNSNILIWMFYSYGTTEDLFFKNRFLFWFKEPLIQFYLSFNYNYDYDQEYLTPLSKIVLIPLSTIIQL